VSQRRFLKTWGRRLSTVVVSLVLLLGLGLAVHQVFVRWQGTRYDFYPRWVGVQAMFREGLDPYGEEVALRSQIGIYGRPARLQDGESQHHFLYPAFIAFTIPHFWLPYPLAVSAWLVTELLMLGAIGILLPACLHRKLRGWQLALFALGLTAFRYNVLSVALGQFTVYVLFYLVLAWWLWDRGSDFWAGCALTQTILKPQLVFLVVPLWLLMAVARRRWHFVAGFAAVLAVLTLLPWPFIGYWWSKFLNPPGLYVRSAGATWLPERAAETLRLMVSAAFWPLAAGVWLWLSGLRIRPRLGLGESPPRFPTLGYALALTVAITLVSTPRIRGYDLALATLPLGFLIVAGYRRGWLAGLIRATGWFLLLALPWLLVGLVNLDLEQLEATERLVVAPAILLLVLLFVLVRPRHARSPVPRIKEAQDVLARQARV
jgi:hypothetical protein